MGHEESEEDVAMVFGSMRLIMLDELYVGSQAQKCGSARDELFENVERPVGPPVQGVKSVGISLHLKGGYRCMSVPQMSSVWWHVALRAHRYGCFFVWRA